MRKESNSIGRKKREENRWLMRRTFGKFFSLPGYRTCLTNRFPEETGDAIEHACVRRGKGSDEGGLEEKGDATSLPSRERKSPYQMGFTRAGKLVRAHANNVGVRNKQEES